MQKKDNRGGAREGAGRPPYKEATEYSEEFKNAILKGLEKKAKKEGKNFGDVFAELLYDKRTQDTTKNGLFKILAEIFTVRESKQKIEKTEKSERPVLILPALSEKPEDIKTKEIEFNESMN